MSEDRPWPQHGRTRLIVQAPLGRTPEQIGDEEAALLAALNPATVLMMGDNPALPRMPERPRLFDFFRCRLGALTRRHMLVSARRALDAGMRETVVLACLLHDIANAGLIRSDHGYWGAQLIGPYVDPEVAFAVRYHQALRYVADAAAGYAYPAAYDRMFGADYVPPDYILRDAALAAAHPWYASARAVTIFDTYFFDDFPEVALEEFEAIVARHFREPAEGLGFDGSPVAHMWRTMIWPDNFL